MSGWSVSAAPKCELTMRVLARVAGKFDAVGGITSEGFTLGGYGGDEGYASVATTGVTNLVVPSVIYVGDPSKPGMTMTATSANITTGDDVTLTYNVDGHAFGIAHTNMTVNPCAAHRRRHGSLRVEYLWRFADGDGYGRGAHRRCLPGHRDRDRTNVYLQRDPQDGQGR